jgi:hypothetical protein
MSRAISQDLLKWGGPAAVWRMLLRLRNKSFAPPYSLDSPEMCLFGKEYWNSWPNKDYTYTFNSWGFRDVDFDQYLKENTDLKVNICVGDSFTLNIGGPAEHSWPHLLSKKLSRPVLNIGVNLLSANHFCSLVDKCKDLFNVDQVFLLYNQFDDVDVGNLQNNQKLIVVSDHHSKMKFLKTHCWVPNAHWQFVPPWTFSTHDLLNLHKQFPGAHEYLKNFKPNWSSLDYTQAMTSTVLINKYHEISGPDWPTYSEFLKLLIVDSNSIWNFFPNAIDTQLVKEFLNSYVLRLFRSNRDGFHMSKAVNQLLADYFYKQSISNQFLT